MGLTVCQLVADLHQADGAFLAADQVLALLGSLVRIEGFQLGGCDKEDIMRKDLLNVVVADRHVFLGLAKDSVDILDDRLEGLHGAVLFGDDLFPVPLVHVDGVDVVGVLVAADRHHVGVQAFTYAESVFSQRVALPFGQGMDDFCHLAGFFDVKRDRALHAIEIVIESGFGADK